MPNPTITASVSSITTTATSLFDLFTTDVCHARTIREYAPAVIENTGDGNILVACVSPDVTPTAADAIELAPDGTISLEYVNTKQCFVWHTVEVVGDSFSFNAMPAALNEQGTLA
jgi:hypothetical protein